MQFKNNNRIRELIAQEAAKIISIEGIRDFQIAKRKASERLGNSQLGSLPSNFEIQRAISTFHNTFSPNHESLINELRHIALEIMEILKEFSPFLTGAVLEGIASTHSPITIHISSDTVESAIMELRNNGIEVEIEQRSLKLNSEYTLLPTLTFTYKNVEVEVVIFNLRQQHQNPKSKTQNRSMQRLNTKALTELIRKTNGKQDLTL